MIYSVRMRAAQGGRHEDGGRHISGAECLVDFSKINKSIEEMVQRATFHTRGQADFINITVEAVTENEVVYAPLLPITTEEVSDVVSGRQAARRALLQAGVTLTAVELGFQSLLLLKDSMRGAMLICATTGQRLDQSGLRGVRVSRMDSFNEIAFSKQLKAMALENTHTKEALLLASKVAAAPGVVAELCWSDDPEYTTGYVASQAGYIRLPHLKRYGDTLGGRIFFVRPEVSVDQLIEYLENQPVLITTDRER